jgi:dTDP-glucose 4,6-dehydratase
MRIFLTGASGLVGSHVLRHLLQQTEHEIICPVSFRHKGLPERIVSAMQGQDVRRVRVEVMDLATPIDIHTANRLGPIDVIMNIASDSHVDRSISRPEPFITNNMALMINLLEYARHVQPWLFLQMSTDEVYGPAPAGHAHREWETMLPSNPYSASKAAQESIAVSYWRTYGVNVVITNTMNIVGETQDYEKMLPKALRSMILGEVMPIHASPEGVPGSRFYLHARNLADAWLFLLNRYMLFPPDKFGDRNVDRPEKWHIVGEREVRNDELVNILGDMIGVKPEMEFISFHQSRPGHDLRYALDGTKLAAAGWKAPLTLEESIARTVRWSLDHPEWLGLTHEDVQRLR